jgi:hypothetical protein
MSYHKAKPLHLQHPSLSSQAVFIQHMKFEKDKRKTSKYRRGNMQQHARIRRRKSTRKHSSSLSFPHQQPQQQPQKAEEREDYLEKTGKREKNKKKLKK